MILKQGYPLKSMMKKTIVCAAAMLMALAPFFSASCAGRKERAKERAGVKVAPVEIAPEFCCVKSAAVLDFHERGGVKGGEGPYTCDVTGLNFIPGSVMEGSGEIVADLTRYYLRERGFIVAGRDETIRAVEKARAAGEPGYSAPLARNAGMALEVDAVVMGSVMRFEERKGTKLAADKPASVAFSVAFVRPQDGMIIWKAKFEKTQKALFEDMLDYRTFFKGGMVWQTADELARIGVVSVLDQLPFKSDKPMSQPGEGGEE